MRTSPRAHVVFIVFSALLSSILHSMQFTFRCIVPKQPSIKYQLSVLEFHFNCVFSLSEILFAQSAHFALHSSHRDKKICCIDSEMENYPLWSTRKTLNGTKTWIKFGATSTECTRLQYRIRDASARHVCCERDDTGAAHAAAEVDMRQ